MRFISKYFIVSLLVIGIAESGCKKLIEVEAPITSTNALNVYNSDITAAAVLTGIYTSLSQETYFSESINSISLYSGLSSDEFTLYSGVTDKTFLAYYQNSLRDDGAGSSFWNKLYYIVYVANSAIEGISKSTAISTNVSNQLIGEAKFVRAFCYFYLTNLYGNVPLVLTTSASTNASIPKSLKSDVYKQIIYDLKEAQDLLNGNAYVFSDAVTSTAERTRPNKWVATALLSRAYLYGENWVDAEAEAASIINNKSLYDTVSFSSSVKAFDKNNKEAIWQLQPVASGQNTPDARVFVLPSSGPTNSISNPVYLSEVLVNSFENDDLRKTNWVNKVTANNVTFYYPFKYKISASNVSVTEYVMVLRLAEQYLIRAEAEAKQNKLNEAVDDLNVIRKRARLPLLSTSLSQQQILDAIMQERRVELFSEWGHRWFDLKRTGTIDAVMNVVTPQKGGTWTSNWALYPIPRIDVQRNESIDQNLGY